MDTSTKAGPKLSEGGRENAQRRNERLAAALRENLRRRKEQLRGRRDAAAEAAGDGADGVGPDRE